MTKADFDHGELLIEQDRNEQQRYNEEYGSKEPEIKALCNECLSLQSPEGIDRLKVLAFIHSTGQKLVQDTNWGRVLGMALILHNHYKNAADSFLLKITNLDQLLYLMRTMRFLCYRHELFGDEEALASLNAVFDEFRMPENARKLVRDAAKVPQDAK